MAKHLAFFYSVVLADGDTTLVVNIECKCASLLDSVFHYFCYEFENIRKCEKRLSFPLIILVVTDNHR